MGLLSAIGRAAPLVAAGVAAGWYLRRQGMLGSGMRPALPAPPEPPPPPPQPDPVIESTAEEEPEPADDPEAELDAHLDAHLDAVASVSDAADVTAVVEDLLGAVPGEADVEEVEMVSEGLPDDAEVAEAVRLALAGEPGLLTGSVDVDVVGGTAWLRGKVAHTEDVERAGRRAASVRGVTAVRNELKLSGGPSE